MRPLWSLQLVVSVLLSLALLTTCRPRSRDGSVTAASILSASVQIGGNSVQDPRGIRQIPGTLRPRSLTFHEFLDIGSGWNMYYSAWPSIALPVQPAAWALTNLYTAILIQARGKWAKSPTQHGFTLTYGGLRILMHCPQKPIPWLFVGNFAEKLLQITEGGWTGVYQVMLSQAENDVSIGVQLMLV